MNWQNLTAQEQWKWNDWVKKHEKAITVIASLQAKGCFYCRHKESNFEAMAFHLRSTHGFAREILVALME